MNNVISVFMDYKINRLVEYGVLIYQQDSQFIRQVFGGYFRTYVDNYYYEVYSTLEDHSKYTLEHFRTELQGIMIEMLEEYRSYELEVSNKEYAENQEVIRKLRDLSFEITRIDRLQFPNKESIHDMVLDLIDNNKVLSSYIEKQSSKLISMIRESYIMEQKLLTSTDTYFSISERRIVNHDDMRFFELEPCIKLLDVYKDGLVSRIFQDDRLDAKKLECLIQKTSLYLLHAILKKEKISQLFIRLEDSVISRGKIDENILNLIDNPLFRRYIVLGVNFNTYLSQRSAFSEDYRFACIQDFSHIYDISQKIESVYQEGIFNYLIVSDCRFKDRDYFIDYHSDSLQVIVFEED